MSWQTPGEDIMASVIIMRYPIKLEQSKADMLTVKCGLPALRYGNVFDSSKLSNVVDGSIESIER